MRKIYDLHFKFRSARAQILADQSRLGVAATIKKSVDLYRGTLAELMGILVDKKISAKLAVCVIGSVARKEQVPQSDVDFVFIADKNLNKREIDKLRLLYRQTIDLLTVFGFPFEAATGIFDTAGRITGKKRDVKANQGVQVRSLQDISFLFGNEGIMLEYRDARLRKVYKNARENVAIIFDEMPVEVTSIKLALRFFSFTKHIASIHLRKRFGSTNSALRGLYEAGLLEKRELGRLRIILDRLLFLRLNLTLPDETLLSEERMKDYLSGISGETSPVRIAENRVFMGRNIDKNHVLKLIKRDVEYIEDFIERFRARLL
ncbi:MAG: DUF294 nucleotidyltransferase-like domain-containing protein [Candidatus Margulisiibacteriota bacterium]|nr:DUF294 nucleotidyltransferase-like domain-containing protein [Candidatus Margulisiibacteriota bacterium]